MKKLSTRTVVFTLSIALLISACLYLSSSPLLFAIKLERLITSKQFTLIYEVDHIAIANHVRAYAWPSDQSSQPAIGRYERGDTRIPDSLWIANPSRILVQSDNVSLEYGGALLHYGIRIFPKGQIGEGTLMLTEGVWFYSENGRYPKTPKR